MTRNSDSPTDTAAARGQESSWTALFERAPENISEATIRELLASHRQEE